MDIGFGEVDFQEIEDQGFINVVVTADGSSSVPIKLIITPFTFDEYANQSGRDLPDMIKTRSMNLDRAECETTVNRFISCAVYVELTSIRAV